jgi:hypothetical protein
MNERTANAALAARTTSRQDVIRVLGCSADACKQGDIPCPCPEQCLLPERWDDDGIGLLRWFLVGLALVAVVILAAHFAARWLQS